MFTICDLDLESETNICSISLLIVLFLHVSASSPNKSSPGYMSSVTFDSSFTFICLPFFSSSRHFICDPSFDSTFSLDHTYSCCNILQRRVRYFFCMYSSYLLACFIFSAYNLYSFPNMYHSCSTFPWFGVHIPPYLIICL